MFILVAVNYDYQYTILCHSEDRNKLENMIAEFERQIKDKNGSYIPRQDFPNSISFGRFTLSKDHRTRNNLLYSCKEFSFHYDDMLEIFQSEPC